MLDGRTGEKEAGRVDGTGSFLPSCGRPAPPVSALVCSCDVSSMGLTGFRVCSLWGLSAYFFMYLFFLRALSTARAAPSVLWWWPHPSLISSKLSSSSCRVFEAGSLSSPSSPHSCSCLSSFHRSGLALVFPFWPWVLWGCVCIPCVYVQHRCVYIASLTQWT